MVGLTATNHCEDSPLYQQQHILSCSSNLSTTTHDSSTSSFSSVSSLSPLTSVDKRFIALMGSALQKIAQAGDAKYQSTLDEFSGTKEPSLSLTDYLKRIFTYCTQHKQTYCPQNTQEYVDELSFCVQALVCAIVYIDRISQRVSVCSRNIHRLLACGMMIAFKMNDDFAIPLPFFAKVCGLSVADLQRMEIEFMKKLEFRAFIDKELFDSRVHLFLSKIALKKKCGGY